MNNQCTRTRGGKNVGTISTVTRDVWRETAWRRETDGVRARPPAAAVVAVVAVIPGGRGARRGRRARVLVARRPPRHSIGSRARTRARHTAKRGDERTNRAWCTHRMFARAARTAQTTSEVRAFPRSTRYNTLWVSKNNITWRIASIEHPYTAVTVVIPRLPGIRMYTYRSVIGFPGYPGIYRFVHVITLR